MFQKGVPRFYTHIEIFLDQTNTYNTSTIKMLLPQSAHLKTNTYMYVCTLDLTSKFNISIHVHLKWTLAEVWAPLLHCFSQGHEDQVGERGRHCTVRLHWGCFEYTLWIMSVYKKNEITLKYCDSISFLLVLDRIWRISAWLWTYIA